MPSTDTYLTRKTGMFPDVVERLALQHLRKGDQLSALITAEWCGCLPCLSFAGCSPTGGSGHGENSVSMLFWTILTFWVGYRGPAACSKKGKELARLSLTTHEKFVICEQVCEEKPLSRMGAAVRVQCDAVQQHRAA